MEEVGRALEGLAAADQAAQSFIGVYTKYLRQQSRGEIEQVSTRLAAVTRGVAAMDESSLAQTRSREARAAAEERFNQAEQALENARANVEALQRSSAYEGKQQLDDLAQAVATLKLSTEQQADKSRKAQAALAQRGDEADKAASSVKRAAEALSRAEDELQAAAEDAGIVWTPLPDGSRSDQITAAVRGHAEERDGDVRVVRTALATVEKAATERTRAENSSRRGQELLEASKAAVLEGEAAVELARSQCASGLRAWWTDHSPCFRLSRRHVAVRSSRRGARRGRRRRRSGAVRSSRRAHRGRHRDAARAST